jgi:hypothetical protein
MVSTLCGNDEEDSLGDVADDALDDGSAHIGVADVVVDVGSAMYVPPAVPAEPSAGGVGKGRGAGVGTVGGSSRATTVTTSGVASVTTATTTTTTGTQCDSGSEEDAEGGLGRAAWGWSGHTASGGEDATVVLVSAGTQWDGPGDSDRSDDSDDDVTLSGAVGSSAPHVDSDDGERPPGLGYLHFTAPDEEALGAEVDALGATFSCLADAESLFDP